MNIRAMSVCVMMNEREINANMHKKREEKRKEEKKTI